MDVLQSNIAEKESQLKSLPDTNTHELYIEIAKLKVTQQKLSNQMSRVEEYKTTTIPKVFSICLIWFGLCHVLICLQDLLELPKTGFKFEQASFHQESRKPWRRIGRGRGPNSILQRVIPAQTYFACSRSEGNNTEMK